MSNTVTSVLAIGVSGLTLRGQLYTSANVASGGAISSGFYERAGSQGIYAFTLTTADDFTGYCDVYANGASTQILACLAINKQELDMNSLADALIRRGRSHSDGSAETGSLYETIGESTQSAAVGTTLTIYATDGTTVFNTRTLTLDADAKPVAAIA